MTVEERCRIPHGELIMPGGHLVLRSMYQFNDAAEVYAFLHCCRKEDCSVYFQNEDISVNKSGVISIPEFAIAVYMSLKENPKIIDSYLRFLVNASSRGWLIDQVEVVE